MSKKKSKKEQKELEKENLKNIETNEDEMDADLDELEATSSAPQMPNFSADSIPTEGSFSKNFRNHPDMENFYRFIYENDLRIEALQILDELLIAKGRVIGPNGEIINPKKSK